MTTTYTLKQLADYLGAHFEGDAEISVTGIANLAKATVSDLSFLSSKQYEHFLETTQAGIVILQKDFEPTRALNRILVDDPYLAYARISVLFCQRISVPQGIHPSAVIDPSARVASTAMVGPNCVVGAHSVIDDGSELLAGVVIGAHCHVGKNCLLHANVVLYHGVTLGNQVIIHSSTVVGSDGFGFAPTRAGWVKIHQLGGVSIGNNVEIGSCTSIDRGAIDDTIIGDGVIIDNQVHIAHNVKIGKGTAIAGCVGIAGSTTIGANCTMGGFVAINGHLEIADNVHFNGGTIVTKSISEAGHYSSGTLVQDVKTWRRNAVRFGQLDQWIDRIKTLEQADRS
jgi:UDP-3-O-[3-hydroxymyristoyl] glucosamine N-acyltransferase